MGTNVIVVNGPPRAGKDRLVDMMANHFKDHGYAVASFSSIDPIKKMLADSGIDTSAKTLEDRKLLAEVGSLVEEHSNFRTNWCVNRVLASGRLVGKQSLVVFLHVREPQNIDRIESRLSQHGIPVWRIFVESPRAETVFSNEADRAVFEMPRFMTIHNNDTLETLDRRAKAAVNILSYRKEFSHAA